MKAAEKLPKSESPAASDMLQPPSGGRPIAPKGPIRLKSPLNVNVGELPPKRDSRPLVAVVPLSSAPSEVSETLPAVEKSKLMTLADATSGAQHSKTAAVRVLSFLCMVVPACPYEARSVSYKATPMPAS